MGGQSGEDHDQRARLIGVGGEHGLAREVICSLPRAVSCRLCRGERDCPYIVERPYGRLVVRKREPAMLVARDLLDVSTGSANDSNYRTPVWQWVCAVIGWMTIPALITWFFLLQTPNWTGLSIPALVMLATFVITIIGVPIVRWGWRDHGGRRKGGPWRPS